MNFQESYAYIKAYDTQDLNASAKMDASLASALGTVLRQLDECRGVLRPLDLSQLLGLNTTKVWQVTLEPEGLVLHQACDVLLDDYDNLASSVCFTDSQDALAWLRHGHHSPVEPLGWTDEDLWSMVDELGLVVSRAEGVFCAQTSQKPSQMSGARQLSFFGFSLGVAVLGLMVEHIYRLTDAQ